MAAAPIPLRITGRPDHDGPGFVRLAYPGYGFTVQPGDMWREPGLDRGGREAWGIVLPNLHVWYTTDRAGGGGWDVTGDPPGITVHPSIDDQDERPWHGWIRGGQLEQA